MSIIKAITDWLLADSEVAAIIEDRVTPGQPPDPGSTGAFPHVTVRRVSGEDVMTMDGPTKLRWIRVQIDCWSFRYQDCDLLAEAIRGDETNPKLSGYSGTLGDYTVQGCFFDNETDVPYRPRQNAPVGLSQTALDFIVWYRRAS